MDQEMVAERGGEIEANYDPSVNNDQDLELLPSDLTKWIKVDPVDPSLRDPRGGFAQIRKGSYEGPGKGQRVAIKVAFSHLRIFHLESATGEI